MITLTLLRNARSLCDDRPLYEGRHAAPLTELGRQQARARAAAWQRQRRSFAVIVTSPLARARETAELVAAGLGVPVELDADWMEFDNGVLSGLPYDIAEREHPRPAFRGPYDPFGGSGESEWDLQGRVAHAIQGLVRRGEGSYLVVAHHGVLNAALRHIVGSPPPINGVGIWFAFGDAGYARAEYDLSRHRWTVLEFAPGPPL